jgi:general stress protein 26
MPQRPVASRPFMPGYGVLPADEGSGLLPWEWAEERLVASRNYWCATVRPDGRPHVMPIWGVWNRSSLWFSTGVWSRKARNLYFERRVTVTTDDAVNPVVIEGVVQIEASPAVIARFLTLLNAKYETGYEIDFQDPQINATVRVRPAWAFGVSEEDFAGSATCWRFAP